MAVDKPSASAPLPASEMGNNEPTLPAGFAYNANAIQLLVNGAASVRLFNVR